MPRGLYNWTFRDVVRFLKKYNFILVNTEGSHYYYSGSVSGKPRLVHVPFHGSNTIKPRTMKSIIDQSGISQKEWTGR